MSNRNTSDRNYGICRAWPHLPLGARLKLSDQRRGERVQFHALESPSMTRLSPVCSLDTAFSV